MAGLTGKFTISRLPDGRRVLRSASSPEGEVVRPVEGDLAGALKAARGERVETVEEKVGRLLAAGRAISAGRAPLTGRWAIEVPVFESEEERQERLRRMRGARAAEAAERSTGLDAALAGDRASRTLTVSDVEDATRMVNGDGSPADTPPIEPAISASMQVEDEVAREGILQQIRSLRNRADRLRELAEQTDTFNEVSRLIEEATALSGEANRMEASVLAADRGHDPVGALNREADRLMASLNLERLHATLNAAGVRLVPIPDSRQPDQGTGVGAPLSAGEGDDASQGAARESDPLATMSATMSAWRLRVQQVAVLCMDAAENRRVAAIVDSTEADRLQQFATEMERAAIRLFDIWYPGASRETRDAFNRDVEAEIRRLSNSPDPSTTGAQATTPEDVVGESDRLRLQAELTHYGPEYLLNRRDAVIGASPEEVAMDDKDVEVEQAARNMPPGIDPNADRALAPGLDRALAPGDMRAIATPPAVRQALERNYVVADVEGRGIVRIVGAVADAPPRAEPHRPETLEQFIARRFDRAEVQPEPAAAPQTEPPPVVTPAEVAASRAVLDGVAAATVTQEPLQEQPGYATARRYASDMYAPDMADAMANEVRDEIVNAVMHNPAEAHDAAPQTEPPQAQARRGRLHPNALYRPEPAGTVSPSPRIQGFWSDDDVRRLQDEMLRIQRENLSLKAEVEKVHHDKVIVRRQLEKLDGLVASLAGKRDEIMAMAERYGKQDEALRRVVDEVFDAVDSASDILLTWNEGDIMQ